MRILKRLYKKSEIVYVLMKGLGGMLTFKSNRLEDKVFEISGKLSLQSGWRDKIYEGTKKTVSPKRLEGQNFCDF
ncbi:hypothetical protein BIV60_25870 [Bacillus sp. MUM 116]|nr:hypothetical protein BIV60_25870 [Bacillus sp. MUM 116]